MNFKEKLLEIYPFLTEIEENLLEEILSRIIFSEYELGSQIFNSKVSCIGFSFILDGRIRIYKLNEDDGREITLYRISKGDSCFNTILCALTDSNQLSFAEVEENAIIGILPMNYFKKLLIDNPSFLKYIFKNLYGKFENVVEGLEKVTFNSIESRIIDYFKVKIEESNGAKIIYTTHEKIAIDIGSSREVVSRNLKNLEKQGILELGRGKIKILKWKY